MKVNTDCKNILTNQSSELKLKFTRKNEYYRKQSVGDMIIGIKLFVVNTVDALSYLNMIALSFNSSL